MPYILYKTDGTRLASIDDATLDLSTDLKLVGRNYSGYGQVVNENFVSLLENFAKSAPPPNPLVGQLWYDKSTRRLHVNHDIETWKAIPNISVGADQPNVNKLNRGDFWWDTNNLQLKAFDGSRFQIIGPLSPSSTEAFWVPGAEEGDVDTSSLVPILKSDIADDITVVVSAQAFDVNVNSTIKYNFDKVKRGITLANANATTGISSTGTNNGTILWGTAAHSLFATTATNAAIAYALAEGGAPSLKSSSSTVSVNYYSTATTSTQSWTIAQRTSSGDLYANNFRGIATAAFYADLAERYESDNPYDAGTVLVIGGLKEVTVTDQQADTAVIGIVSTNPALMMNAEAGTDDTHPFIALKGRVPCKVHGPVKKGEMLVTSNKPGYAQAWRYGDSPNAVVGKALENHSEGPGVIEVLVV